MTPPIACQLKALDAAGRARQKALLGIVQGKVQRSLELDDGFELQLPADRDTFVEVAEWVGLERLCCPFADFAIEWRGDDTVWVRVRGPEGAKEVLAAEMRLGMARGKER